MKLKKGNIKINIDYIVGSEFQEECLIGATGMAVKAIVAHYSTSHRANSVKETIKIKQHV